MNILFWLRKNQINKKGNAPLWCSIYINHLKEEFSCKISINPKNWDQDSQSSNGLYGEYDNSQIQIIAFKLLEIKTRLDVIGKTYSLRDIKNEITGKNEIKNGFIEQFDKLVEEKKIKNPDMRLDSLKKYATLRKNYINFLKATGKTDLQADEFTPVLMAELELFLYKNLKQCSKNHALRHLEGIKTVQKYCAGKGNAYNKEAKEFISKRSKSKKILYLKKNEIELLKTFNFNSDKLKMVADLFLFQSWTGFAYVDLFGFDYFRDVEVIQGKEWVIRERKKTDNFPQMPLFPIPKAILAKYNNKLPYMSNKDYNLYLKIIGGCLNLKFNLTSHIARKTAGTQWLNEGISLDVVSKMLGHKNIQTTKDMYAFLDLERVERETRIFFKESFETEVA